MSCLKHIPRKYYKKEGRKVRKRKALAMFLSVLLICSMTAEVFAEGSGASEDADLSLAAVIEGKLKELKADPDHVSIALKNTVTGEYYYYNADRWMYTASLYKLPVCMTFSHMLKTGELEPGTMTLSDDAAMGKVLEMSNNTWIGKLEIAVYGSRNCQKEKHA